MISNVMSASVSGFRRRPGNDDRRCLRRLPGVFHPVHVSGPLPSDTKPDSYADGILVAEFKNLRLPDTRFPQLDHERGRFNRFCQEMDTECNALRGGDHAGDRG